MKMQVEDKGLHKIKDILYEDPEYIRIKEELERHRMREEELKTKIKAI